MQRRETAVLALLARALEAGPGRGAREMHDRIGVEFRDQRVCVVLRETDAVLECTYVDRGARKTQPLAERRQQRASGFGRPGENQPAHVVARAGERDGAMVA